MQPRVSVIVPTYNGELEIHVLLRALQAQTYQDFECLIVIDGSGDKTQEIVEATQTKFRKVIINQSNQGRSVAKNNGAKRASGNLLIFFDDDMEPNSKALEMHIAFHESHDGIVSGNLAEDKGRDRTDIQNYKAGLASKWIQKYQEGLNLLDPSNLFFTAANSSFKRNDFLDLNGFDERLKDAEDYDIACRALEMGMKVFFDKSNVAIHHDRISCVSYIQRLRQYQQAHAILNKLHPERVALKKLQTNSFVKGFVYRIFAFSFWPRLIDNYNLLMVLPKKLRYKIYDTLIHSLAIEFPTVDVS